MTGPLAHPAPRNGAQPIQLVTKIFLPNGLHLWVVADDASMQQLAKGLTGKNLVVTLAWLEDIWKAGQNRIVVPNLMPVS